MLVIATQQWRDLHFELFSRCSLAYANARCAAHSFWITALLCFSLEVARYQLQLLLEFLVRPSQADYDCLARTVVVPSMVGHGWDLVDCGSAPALLVETHVL